MPDPLTDADLAAIEERVNEAQRVGPPPWNAWLETRHGTGGGSFVQFGGAADEDNEMYLDVRLNQRQLISPSAELDAIVDFIGNAPEDVHSLVAEVHRLRGRLDELRGFQIDRLNDALRRPGMWGGETTIRLFLDMVAFADGLDEAWRAEQQTLRDRGAFNAVGVHGAVTELMPGYRDDGTTVASVYADIAWRHGWLTVDRTLPDPDLGPLRDHPGLWCTQDRNLDDVLTDLGPPSVLFGGGNPRYAKTLAYASADRIQPLVCLHFAAAYDWDTPSAESEPPVLVAVRHGEGPFHNSFAFTPAGLAYRSSAAGDDPTVDR
jgi:hypothetical protein